MNKILFLVYKVDNYVEHNNTLKKNVNKGTCRYSTILFRENKIAQIYKSVSLKKKSYYTHFFHQQNKILVTPILRLELIFMINAIFLYLY